MIEKEDDFFHNKYYVINLRVSCIAGVWAYQSTLTTVILTFLVFVISESTLIPQVNALIKIARVDPTATLLCLPTIIIGIACGMKLTNAIYQKGKIRVMFNKVKADWAKLRNEKEVQIMCAYSYQTRLITMGYAFLLYFSATSYVILPFVSPVEDNPNKESVGKYLLPFEVDYFVDQKTYYFPIFIHICLSMILHIVIAIASNCTFATFVQHVCGLFAILSHRLEHAADLESVDEDPDSEFVQNRIHDNIADCILVHNEILDFVNKIEAAYSMFFFLEVGLNMIIMSLTAVQMVLYTSVFQEFLRHFAHITVQFMHLFSECWQAQKIIDHSHILYDAIGKVQWYRASGKTKKLIVIMMMRSIINCKLTAQNMFPLCLETFTAVVSKSMSYFTVLRTMQ